MVFDSFYSGLGISVWLLIVISIWEAIWTGLAMWRSAKNNHVIWFVVFLLVNLLAIPEIIYLIVTSKKHRKKRR